MHLIPVISALSLPILVALVLVAPSWVGASNLMWLDTAPVRYFSEQDWEIFTEAFDRALDEGPDGAEVEWRNEKSGSRGLVRPLSTEMGEEGLCRKVRIDNYAGGFSGSGTMNFCRQPDGSWKIVTRRSDQPALEPIPEKEDETDGQKPFSP